ncbi:peptide chain release factor H [Massilia sp. METH4]|uniref:peptide chain release factor H n=1 Tax=Massilia sp. METH4 TaxID=3123041 RepID=UPI0030D5981B
MAMLIQISANTGPAECCLGVVKMLAHVDAAARHAGLSTAVVDEVAGEGGTLKSLLQSVLLSVDGDDAAVRRFAEAQAGTVLWVCACPFRPRHPRKNWFLDVAVFAPPAGEFEREVVFDTMRASGPGGQHVNKTETAVRATHVASGLSVKVGESRSQRANKAAALALLYAKLQEQLEGGVARDRAERRARHAVRPGGEAIQRFVGPRFIEEAYARSSVAPS